VTPATVGEQALNTSLTVVQDNLFGNIRTVEKRLMAYVNVLSELSVEMGFSVSESAWFSGGDSAWGLDSANYAAGGAALRSGRIANNEISVLQGFVEGPRTLEAYVLIDSEAGYDFLVVSVDDQEQERLSGNLDWQLLSIDIPPSGAIVRFDYVKDNSGEAGRDAVWLDFVSPGDSLSQDRFLVNADDGLADSAVDNTGVNNGGSEGGTMSLRFLLLFVGLGLARLNPFQLKIMSLARVARGAGSSILMVLGAAVLVGCTDKHADATAASAANKTGYSTGHAAIKTAAGIDAASTAAKPQKQRAKPVEEPLYSKGFDGHRLTVQVRTLGCTSAASFRLIESRERQGWYTLERIKPDVCRRAPMIMTVTIPIPAAILNKIKTSDHPTQMRLTNIEVPSVGIPIIPPVVNP
jgi:hypothetical protein